MFSFIAQSHCLGRLIITNV